jgi:hypothetical protein
MALPKKLMQFPSSFISEIEFWMENYHAYYITTLYSRCLLKHKAEAWFGWELVGERHFTNK